MVFSSFLLLFTFQYTRTAPAGKTPAILSWQPRLSSLTRVDGRHVESQGRRIDRRRSRAFKLLILLGIGRFFVQTAIFLILEAIFELKLIGEFRLCPWVPIRISSFFPKNSTKSPLYITSLLLHCKG